MTRLWYISTTLREPSRLRGFLSVSKDMEGVKWNKPAQIEFQTRLIQARLYGFRSAQFYRNLSESDIALLESNEHIPYERAEQMMQEKNYEDPPMRGRNSYKPLEKLGFASIDDGGCMRITEAGQALLAEKDDYGDIFLRVLLKWQIPNPLDKRGFPARCGYNIKPFVGVLRLIDAVNQLCRTSEMKATGLSFAEFMGFAVTLIDYREIGETAEDIFHLRRRTQTIAAVRRKKFVLDEIYRLRKGINLNNARDYADNAIRYFRLTKYVRMGEWGKYINLEPMRKNELTALFDRDDARPHSFEEGEYAQNLASMQTPDLPGETKPELERTIRFLIESISSGGGDRNMADTSRMGVGSLKKLRGELRTEIAYVNSQKEKSLLSQPQEVENCINELEDLSRWKRSDGIPRSVKLEWLAARGMNILNDAEKIRPNYTLGDDGLPSGHALPGKADIECYYGGFVSTCEVTMMTDSKQWMHETQPVMRHLREFGQFNKGKPAYCLFIAPKLHRDTINMFNICTKGGYENEQQRIVPMTVEQFCDILRYASRRTQLGNPISSSDIKSLLDGLSSSLKTMTSSEKWRENAAKIIDKWKQTA